MAEIWFEREADGTLTLCKELSDGRIEKYHNVVIESVTMPGLDHRQRLRVDVEMRASVEEDA